MTLQRTSTWARLRRAVGLHSDQLATGSVIGAPLPLLAVEQERETARRRAEEISQAFPVPFGDDAA